VASSNLGTYSAWAKVPATVIAAALGSHHSTTQRQRANAG
jgi:hypothetical protein